MRKLSLGTLCMGVALVIGTSDHARGGYGSHSDPVFAPVNKQKTNHRAPVVRSSPKQRHYPLTNRPQ